MIIVHWNYVITHLWHDTGAYQYNKYQGITEMEMSAHWENLCQWQKICQNENIHVSLIYIEVSPGNWCTGKCRYNTFFLVQEIGRVIVVTAL